MQLFFFYKIPLSSVHFPDTSHFMKTDKYFNLLANAKNPSFITFITRLTSKLALAHIKITIIRSRIKKKSSELQ